MTCVYVTTQGDLRNGRRLLFGWIGGEQPGQKNIRAVANPEGGAQCKLLFQ